MTGVNPVREVFLDGAIQGLHVNGINVGKAMVAAGVEHWFLSKRLGVRGGGRVNTTGAEERVVTAGVSVGA